MRGVGFCPSNSPWACMLSSSSPLPGNAGGFFTGRVNTSAVHVGNIATPGINSATKARAICHLKPTISTNATTAMMSARSSRGSIPPMTPPENNRRPSIIAAKRRAASFRRLLMPFAYNECKNGLGNPRLPNVAYACKPSGAFLLPDP